ncbi:MAG: beta-ketoacyl-ACP synthase [Deltaproteobacteria bacterium]|nr:beta-ketoacyl-ACP synthase [Deltaproteobacteria bacterium]MBN2673290.1 beta-ketoacyl-ACP synthase [Deltaproteobacteria bacterium]
MICALGATASECSEALFANILPQMSQRETADGTVVPVFEAPVIPALPEHFSVYECRNNRLAFACYQQVESAVRAHAERISPDRLGVVLGSSTSGLDASEFAFEVLRQTGYRPDTYNFDTQHAMGSLSQFVTELAGAKGPAYTVSTACSSAAKAMLSAKGLIDAGICDAVITGGVDSLCALTVNGFGALGQLSTERMNPLSKNRSGLNIGEGGALFLLTRDSAGVQLLGGGESMDAYHMSAPQPEGVGAELAMKRALDDAAVCAADVMYVNLHGTATRANDAMETQAVKRLLPETMVSSSKPLFGHCLGAAGAIEAAICCISLADTQGRLPAHHFDGSYDTQLPVLPLASVKSRYRDGTIRRVVMSNSFAFGGNNCALVLGESEKGERE